jgi:serine/threonine-protein kinase
LDGTIWFDDFIDGSHSFIAHMAAAGGVPLRIGNDATFTNDVYPQLLPGGKAILATDMSRGMLGTAHVAALSVESGERHTLYEGTGAQYTPTGHLIFARGNTLYAVPFDAAQLTSKGTPVPVVDNVQVNSGGLALFAFSNDGTLAYVPGSAGTSRSLVWVDRQGREEPIGGMAERSYAIPQLSPDGRELALDLRDQQSDIYIWDMTRPQLNKLTNDPAVDGFPVWSPDSRRIAFGSMRGGAMNLFLQDLDRTDAERLTQSSNAQVPVTFSRDGQQLFFLEDTAIGGTNLRRVAMTGGRREETLIGWPIRVTSASIAPDESWVAYQMSDSGQEEIFVQTITTGERHQISNGGGTRPLWTQNGRDLFYIGGDDRLTGVTIQITPTFNASEPTPLLPARYFVGGPGRTFAVSRDGERFLMIKEGSLRAQAGHIVIVQNWFEELKRLAPVK